VLADKDAKVVAIVGAGPAGLTAALELLRRSDVLPVMFDLGDQVGGISKTIDYRGNRMDLGGHRFFSKSDWVMRWWQEILPVAEDQIDSAMPLRTTYQRQSKEFMPRIATPESSDAVLLVRQRLSRIYYRRRFFDYPLKLSPSTLRKIGAVETFRIGLSYGRARVASFRPAKSLEEFFIDRFGDRLYRTFFKDYTEKVWGVPCHDIPAEWGAQRIKGLSIGKALAHALRSPFRASDTSQKRTETSLIERFLYPKLGPGQMWEAVARRVQQLGGRIHLKHRVVGIERKGFHVTAIRVRNEATNSHSLVPCDYLISTMPVRDLTACLDAEDSSVARIARALPYRDFMTVGLLLRRMAPVDGAQEAIGGNGMLPDQWIYIQEPDVKIGRLQVFNNWSPAMVADPSTIWLGLEYFCRDGDELWSMNDPRFIDFAASELEKIGLIDRRDVIDGTLVRVPKAYPAYFGSYGEFGKVRAYLDHFSNLYPVGRNGMHRYNNQDHSMLAAKLAVDSILSHGSGKAQIWDVNAEAEYHESVANSPSFGRSPSSTGASEVRTGR
jgi:protoporphyrinogen oxidase